MNVSEVEDWREPRRREQIGSRWEVKSQESAVDLPVGRTGARLALAHRASRWGTVDCAGRKPGPRARMRDGRARARENSLNRTRAGCAIRAGRTRGQEDKRRWSQKEGKGKTV